METKGIRIFAETLILPLASSTHRVEAMVRECTHAAGTNRGEESRSWYIMLRSVFNTKINEIAFTAREDKVFRGNHHWGPGKEGKREVRSEIGKKNTENLSKNPRRQKSTTFKEMSVSRLLLI